MGYGSNKLPDPPAGPMEVLGDIAIANPLADEDKLDKELERDSDAVVSTFYPEQLKAGELMSNSDSGPSVLYGSSR